MIGLLTHLSTALGRSEAESAALLNAFVREVHALTRTQGEATYPGLGTFRTGADGGLEFRPDASLALVVNHRFAGLTPVPVQPSPQQENAFAGASPQTGWMTPPAPLETVGATHLPGDGRFTQATPPGYAAPLPAGYAAPATGFPSMPPPGEIPPLGAYGAADPYTEPYTAPRFAATPSPEAAAYVPPTGMPYTAPTYTAPAMPPPAAHPSAYPEAAYTEASFTEATPFGPATGPSGTPPLAPPPRAAVPRRNLVPAATLVLLAALGLLAWYVWATRPAPGGPMATVTTPTPGTVTPTPAFTLPPPDSVPPAAAGALDSPVPDPTTPVDPGASAADPLPAADSGVPPPSTAASPASAASPAPSASVPSAATPTASAPGASASPTRSASPRRGGTPAVRRTPSPYTPYTGSSRPDRSVRRSPPRRAYTGPVVRTPGGSRRAPAPVAPTPQTPPPPVRETPRTTPAQRPATPATAAEIGLTPELEDMLLGEENVMPGAGWTIVVRGEPTEDAARLVAERYRMVGYRVNVMAGLTSFGQPIYRVVVGQFDTVPQAQRALRTLAGDAFPADAWMLPLGERAGL